MNSMQPMQQQPMQAGKRSPSVPPMALMVGGAVLLLAVLAYLLMRRASGTSGGGGSGSGSGSGTNWDAAKAVLCPAASNSPTPRSTVSAAASASNQLFISTVYDAVLYSGNTNPHSVQLNGTTMNNAYAITPRLVDDGITFKMANSDGTVAWEPPTVVAVLWSIDASAGLTPDAVAAAGMTISSPLTKGSSDGTYTTWTGPLAWQRLPYNLTNFIFGVAVYEQYIDGSSFCHQLTPMMFITMQETCAGSAISNLAPPSQFGFYRTVASYGDVDIGDGQFGTPQTATPLVGGAGVMVQLDKVAALEQLVGAVYFVAWHLPISGGVADYSSATLAYYSAIGVDQTFVDDTYTQYAAASTALGGVGSQPQAGKGFVCAFYGKIVTDTSMCYLQLTSRFLINTTTY